MSVLDDGNDDADVISAGSDTLEPETSRSRALTAILQK